MAINIETPTKTPGKIGPHLSVFSLVLLAIVVPLLFALHVGAYNVTSNNLVDALPFAIAIIIWLSIYIINKNNHIVHLLFLSKPGGDTYKPVKRVFNGKALNVLSQQILKQKKKTDHYQAHCKQLQQQQKRIHGELNVARDLQNSLLPREIKNKLPVSWDIDIYADLLPATEVGGDFYDTFQLDDDNLFIAIGDVCGKGIPSCVLMAHMLLRLRSLVKEEYGKQKTQCLPNTLNKINTSYFQADSNQRLFVSVVIAILNVKTGELVYCNAGHNPVCIINKATGASFLNNKSKPLGISHDTVYQEKQYTLQKGEGFLLYTDGLIETQNNVSQQFGYDKLSISLQGRKNLKAERVVKSVFKDVQQFSLSSEPSDDMTAVLVWFKPQKSNPTNKTHQETKSKKTHSCLCHNNIKEIVPTQIEIMSFLLANKVGEKHITDLMVCLEEALTNLCLYGYSEQQGASIAVSMKLYERHLALEIADDTTPFDITAIKDIAMTSSGGRGIRLIQGLMDEVHYFSVNGKNYLQMVKKMAV